MHRIKSPWHDLGVHPDQRAATDHPAVGRAVAGHPGPVQRRGEQAAQQVPPGGRQAQPQHQPLTRREAQVAEGQVQHRQEGRSLLVVLGRIDIIQYRENG